MALACKLDHQAEAPESCAQSLVLSAGTRGVLRTEKTRLVGAPSPEEEERKPKLSRRAVVRFRAVDRGTVCLECRQEVGRLSWSVGEECWRGREEGKDMRPG